MAASYWLLAEPKQKQSKNASKMQEQKQAAQIKSDVS
jgi:hypothetical protein